MSRRAIALGALACAVLLAAACDEKKGKGAPTGASARPTAATSAAPSPPPPLPAVYEKGPVEALAKRYCDAVVDHPAKRRADCCKSVPSSPAAACERNLSDAVRAKALEIDEASLATCAREIEAQHAGCDWVGPNAPELPDACVKALVGRLPAGGRCRSSIECEGALHCRSVGAQEAGRCTPPQPRGAPCDPPLEGLAPFTRRASEVARTRRVCEGVCELRACADKKRDGEACAKPGDCMPGLACEKGACTAARGKLGGPCLAGCDSDARCVDGTCKKPKLPGAACARHEECARGGCSKKAGAKVGACGAACAD